MSILQQFGENIWIADGPRVRFMVGSLPTRMIVVKLCDDSLWINSPVESPVTVLDEIKALGPVRYLVAPTPMHMWRTQPWGALFPDAEIWTPAMLGDAAPAAWAQEISQVVFRGNAFLDEVEFFHQPSRTLVVTDFIQNYPEQRGDVFWNAAKAFGGVLDGGVPRDIRWSVTNRKKARESVARLLSFDFDKVIVAHGECITHDARTFVETAFRWLQH